MCSLEDCYVKPKKRKRSAKSEKNTSEKKPRTQVDTPLYGCFSFSGSFILSSRHLVGTLNMNSSPQSLGIRIHLSTHIKDVADALEHSL
eukprot:m.329387 g.329387  ORF g.329387 m.329387 type:complete len:89 (-) comp16567_c0_seq2:2145-2411(-)